MNWAGAALVPELPADVPAAMALALLMTLVLALAAADVAVARMPPTPALPVLEAPETGAGPSQSQWSPWGTQPIEAVGLGPGSRLEPVTGAFSSWLDVDATGRADVVITRSVARGSSQSQWSLCGTQPIEAVGLGPGSTLEPDAAGMAVAAPAELVTRGPSQSLESCQLVAHCMLRFYLLGFQQKANLPVVIVRYAAD